MKLIDVGTTGAQLPAFLNSMLELNKAALQPQSVYYPTDIPVKI